MVRIIENSLAFTFPANWTAIKYDDTAWYSEKINRAVKAMDILATDGNVHWWIEIKDFRNHEQANLNKFNPPPTKALNETEAFIKNNHWDGSIEVKPINRTLTEDLFLKVLGTMGGLAASFRASNIELSAFHSSLTHNSELRIVLLFTWSPREWGRLALRLNQLINQKLNRIGLNCMLIDEHRTIPGFNCSVTRLP